MRKSAKSIMATAGALTLVVGSLIAVPHPVRAADSASVIDEGKAISFDRKKGNCLACHKIAGGSLPGNIGPELVNMKARFPDKAVLRAQIWDATAKNPHSIMPPFGKFKILSESDIDKVVELIYSL